MKVLKLLKFSQTNLDVPNIFFYLIFPSKSIIWVKVEDYTQSWFWCYTFPPYLLWFSRLWVYPVTFFTFFVLLVAATGVLINCFEMHRCSGWIEKWWCCKMHFPLEKALLNYRYTSGKNIHVHHKVIDRCMT